MKKLLFFVILIAYSRRLPHVEANDDVPSTFSYKTNSVNGNLTVLEKYEIIEKKFKDLANAAVKMVLPVFMENSEKLNLSKECLKNSMHLIYGVKNIKTWAMRFLDSSGKIIDGILLGTLSSIGSFDECVNTEVKSTKLQNKGEVLFRGQYCSIELVPPVPPTGLHLSMHEVAEELKNFSQRDTAIAEGSKLAHIFHNFHLKIGVCVPSGCSVGDIDKVARALGDAMLFSARAARCEVKEENEYTPLIITVIACCSFAGFLALVASLVDIYASYKKLNLTNNFIRALLAFSFISNFKKFVNTEASSHMFSCLNGVRCITMTWVIISHAYLLINFQLILGLLKARNAITTLAFQVVANSSFAVDTFFFMGALVLSYSVTKRFRIEGHKFNIVWYIFHRLWRLLPVYVFVIMFMFLLHLFGSGPVWHETIDKYMIACQDNWWANLIFINNFYEVDEMCIPHSWYLASDFQLYVGALIILLPMISKPKAGILLSVVGIIVSIIYSGVGTYVNGYPYMLSLTVPDEEKIKDHMAHFYFKPYIHISPYCIGILAGYLLATKPDLKIPPIVQLIGWSLAFAGNLSVAYGTLEWNRGAEPFVLTGILYASFYRTVWTLGVAWMIICCATGHGGIINYILSWKAFIPLGRLTYVAYLAHLPLQLVFWGNIRTRIQADHFLTVWIIFGHLCISYGIAFAGSMLIEAPFLSLEKILLAKELEKPNKALSNGNFDLKRSFKSEKNGNISSIISKKDEESGGIDNSHSVNTL